MVSENRVDDRIFPGTQLFDQMRDNKPNMNASTYFPLKEKMKPLFY